MQPEEQITVKDIILKIISMFKAIFKNWKIVLLFGILGGGLGFLYDYKNLSDSTYKSTTEFYLETAVPSTDGGFAAMFGGGGGGGGGLFSGENLSRLIKSSDFIEKILLREIVVGGKKQIMCNYFRDKNKPSKKAIDEKVKDDYLPLKHTNKAEFTLKEFNSLAIVQGPAINATDLKPVEKSSFMTLDVTTLDDTLSKVYADVFLETLREYYMDSKTSKLRTSIKQQERIVDSLRYLSQVNESSLARIQDQNEEAVFAQGKVIENRLTRKSQMVTNSYSEQQRTLDNMKLQLYQDSPLFKITSPQRFPLIPSEASLTKNYKTGIYIGIFISLIFIVLYDAVKSIMKEEKI